MGFDGIQDLVRFWSEFGIFNVNLGIFKMGLGEFG